MKNLWPRRGQAGGRTDGRTDEWRPASEWGRTRASRASGRSHLAGESVWARACAQPLAELFQLSLWVNRGGARLRGSRTKRNQTKLKLGSPLFFESWVRARTSQQQRLAQLVSVRWQKEAPAPSKEEEGHNTRACGAPPRLEGRPADAPAPPLCPGLRSDLCAKKRGRNARRGGPIRKRDNSNTLARARLPRLRVHIHSRGGSPAHSIFSRKRFRANTREDRHLFVR